ncbi:hypothetical protein [Mucilaginibacter lappiensis]
MYNYRQVPEEVFKDMSFGAIWLFIYSLYDHHLDISKKTSHQRRLYY